MPAASQPPSPVSLWDRRGPLVAPGPPLSDEQRARAARQLLLPGFGELAQRRLHASRVLVIGAGGLGSASIPYLAGAGVGTIGIIDDDAVELSNLHRQIAHTTADIGRSKVDSLAEAVVELNPNVAVNRHDLRLSASNALEIFADYDLVIDGCDNFPTRYLANDAACLSGIPLVWGAILAHHGQVGVAWHQYGPGYRDLFPRPPAPDEVVTCASGGVLPSLCGVVGSLLATEAIKLITGTGEPLVGRVLVYDALRATTRELTYAPDPAAAPVTELIDYELFCAGPAAANSISAAELLARLHQTSQPVMRVVDVRNLDECETGTVAGADIIPLAQLEAGAGEFDPTVPVAIYCAQGPRSARAAQLLAQRGLAATWVVGGISAINQDAAELITNSTAPSPKVEA